jgi:hypothetical protein
MQKRTLSNALFISKKYTRVTQQNYLEQEIVVFSHTELMMMLDLVESIFDDVDQKNLAQRQ